ncbi:MAG TPA: secretin N-terminal domain-containing protein [Sumerlaeia bacterium]|nr:secretin N-terminal domain-containing protein [Sumerlaeia bacterium]
MRRTKPLIPAIVAALTLFLGSRAPAGDPAEVSFPDSALRNLSKALVVAQTAVASESETQADPGGERESPPAPEAVGSGTGTVKYRDLGEREKERPLTEANEILASRMMLLDFRGTELQDVLRAIAAKSGLNIIMNPEGVSGKVTLHLENIRLGIALEQILAVNNLAYVVSEEENIVRIVDAKTVGITDVETRTETIQVNWVSAAELSKTLENFTSEHGKIVANAETNTLIITDTPPQLTIMKGLIERLDVGDRQVMVEARLIDMQMDAGRQLGINMDIWRRDAQGTSFVDGLIQETVSGVQEAITETITETTTDPLQEPEVSQTRGITRTIAPDTVQTVSVPSDGAKFNLPAATGGVGLDWAFGDRISIFGRTFNIAAQLQALESRKLVEILANPRVVTLNNIPARIKIVREIPYTEGVTSVSGATTVEVEFKEVGIEIDVTPIITPNNFIRLNLRTQQKIHAGDFQSGVSAVPIIDLRDADTNVIVEDGETVMIGGLRQLDFSDTSQGVPWFHEIPVLGWLFKNKDNQDHKTELFLFVTPTIIDVEEAELTTEEMAWYERIDSKWHLPDYFFDDVKTAADK